jgi:hypothetical protein
MPVSKTDARAGTLRGRYKALRRWFRDRADRLAEVERLDSEARRERISVFWAKVNRDDTNDLQAAWANGIKRGRLSSFAGYRR